MILMLPVLEMRMFSILRSASHYGLSRHSRDKEERRTSVND